MAKELNPRQIEKAQLPPGKKESVLYDGDNLMLRLRGGARGVSKTWLLRYTVAGQRKKIALGSFPLLSLAEARDAALVQLKKIEQGVDPHEERATAEATALAHEIANEGGDVPITIQELFERWDKEYLQYHHSDGGQYVRALFRNHILVDRFGDLSLRLTKKAHIIAMLNRIREKKVTRTCGVALTNVRQMFRWSEDHEWTDRDPTRGLTAETWKGASIERERFLEDDEIKQLSKALHKSDLGEKWKHGLWLILAVGTRVEETLLAKREHVSLEARTWFIPKENQKRLNRVPLRDRTVQLSEFAATHAAALLSNSCGSAYLFPARVRGGNQNDSPANHKTLSHAVRDRQRTTPIKGRINPNSELILTGGEWTVHDLRRTMATHMQELGVASDIIDKCQGHVIEGKVRRTYQRAELRTLMANAWQSWGDHLKQLLDEAEDERRLELEHDGKSVQKSK